MSDPRWPDDGPTWPQGDVDPDDDREFWPRDDAASGPHAEPAPPPPIPEEDAWAPGDARDGGWGTDAQNGGWGTNAQTGGWEADTQDRGWEADTQDRWETDLAPSAAPDGTSQESPGTWLDAAPSDAAPAEAAPPEAVLPETVLPEAVPREAPPAEAPPPETVGPEAPPPAAFEPPPAIESGEPTTAFNGTAWDPKQDGERRRPTTAEQAVPWMIGIILALAGIVIVLLALIFSAPEGLIATTQSPSASPSSTPEASLPAGIGGSSQPSPAGSAAASPSVEATPEATPTPLPEYGPLEMVYLGRPSALEPIYLMRRDFSEDKQPRVMAQAAAGVSSYAWAPDGTVGAAIIDGRLVALTPGKKARPLADDIAAATFGWDAGTVYAVRTLADGADQVARVIQIDFDSGEASVLGAVSYPRPVIGPDAPLKEAQFIDNGGLVRLYAVADGNLALWILGAPAPYRIDAGDGSVTEADRQPILWSPNGRQRVEVREKADGSTDLILRDGSNESLASVNVNGLVSHVRWADGNNEIVFTLGQQGSSGGVRQDLWVWDLVDGRDPLPLTSNGASFGAEWVGAGANWLP